MKRDDRWNLHWHEVMEYLDHNDRNPSKHRTEDLPLINWLKVNRKKRNAGLLRPDRVEMFKQLTDRMAAYRRANQNTDPLYKVMGWEDADEYNPETDNI